MQASSSTPFVEIIASLAILHREQQQALLELRSDQERCFQAILQTQQEDREAFRSWIDREVPREPTEQPAVPVHLPLNKMGPLDDPEVFLELFERSAEACKWPLDQWSMRLVPLLSGEAQVAAQQLPVQNLLVYDDRGRGGTGQAPSYGPRGAGLPAAGTDPTPASPLSPRHPFSPLSATGAAGRSGPACWRCGDPDHFVDKCPVMEVGTMIRVPDDPQAAPGQAGGYQIP
ncbi:uncharacterized protein [Chanodichthys erythropterus]|uniref:uncharacterized protein n=1 Tax=Chanodichthys erythropterus TaxID=933992 RepID=UPI00351DD148